MINTNDLIISKGESLPFFFFLQQTLYIFKGLKVTFV